MPVDINKLIELVIKYKQQVTYLLCLIFCIGIFIGGRMSVTIPPKSEVCQGELKTIDKQFKQLQNKDKLWTERLNEQRDLLDNECKDRIKTEVDRLNTITNIVTCEEVCTLYPQCNKAKKCK